MVICCVNVVCCQVYVNAKGRSIVRGSPTECLSVISKPQQWGGLGPSRAVVPEEEIVCIKNSNSGCRHYTFLCITCHFLPLRPTLFQCVLPLGRACSLPYVCLCTACGRVCAVSSDGHDSINDVASWSVVSASAFPHASFSEMPGYMHAGIGNPRALLSRDE